MSDSSRSQPLVLTFGHDELIIRRRYEVMSIINDILVAVWFLIGSVFFFYESLVTVGTWLFVAGSVELMIRPVIRLSRKMHLQRKGSASPVASSQDF